MDIADILHSRVYYCPIHSNQPRYLVDDENAVHIHKEMLCKERCNWTFTGNGQKRRSLRRTEKARTKKIKLPCFLSQVKCRVCIIYALTRVAPRALDVPGTCSPLSCISSFSFPFSHRVLTQASPWPLACRPCSGGPAPASWWPRWQISVSRHSCFAFSFI